MVSIEELKKKYKPIPEVVGLADFGECIAIPLGEFIPAWDVPLVEQGHMVRTKGGVVYVSLKKDPPPRKGFHKWTFEEDALLISLWATEGLTTKKLCKRVIKKFPELTPVNIKYRISKLQKEGRINSRYEAVRTKRRELEKTEKSETEEVTEELFQCPCVGCTWKGTIEDYDKHVKEHPLAQIRHVEESPEAKPADPWEKHWKRETWMHFIMGFLTQADFKIPRISVTSFKKAFPELPDALVDLIVRDRPEKSDTPLQS